MNHAGGADDFYELVEKALESLPAGLSGLLENVAIVVEDWPNLSSPLSQGSNDLYGLYEGVPLDRRGAGYWAQLPDRITIFRGPLERDFPPEKLEEQVRITVIHELAHHFGIDDGHLEELGWA